MQKQQDETVLIYGYQKLERKVENEGSPTVGKDFQRSASADKN